VFFFFLGGAAFLFLMVATAVGQTAGEAFTDNWWLAGPALVAAAGLIAGGAFGLVSVFRQGEHSLVVSLATVIGVFAAAFVAGEILAPR
jgi:hypothetical protein